MSMGLLRLLRGNKASAPVARERLQILLAHERGLRGQPDLLGVLREEILAVVSRHVTLDPTKVIVRTRARRRGLDPRGRYRGAQRFRAQESGGRVGDATENGPFWGG